MNRGERERASERRNSRDASQYRAVVASSCGRTLVRLVCAGALARVRLAFAIGFVLLRIFSLFFSRGFGLVLLYTDVFSRFAELTLSTRFWQSCMRLVIA